MSWRSATGALDLRRVWLSVAVASVELVLPDNTSISTTGDDIEIAQIVRRLRIDFQAEGGCWFRGVAINSQHLSSTPMLTWVPATAVVRAYFDAEGPDDFGQPDVWVQ